MARYEMIANNDAILPVVDEPGNKLDKQETDLNFIEHARITIEATFLRDIVAELTTKYKNYASAFKKGFDRMTGAKKWDLDTLKTYISDARIAIHNNKFNLVKERIITGRINLYNLYKNYISMKVATTAQSGRMEVETTPPQQVKVPTTASSGQMDLVTEEEDTTMSAGRRPLYEHKTRKQ